MSSSLTYMNHKPSPSSTCYSRKYSTVDGRGVNINPSRDSSAGRKSTSTSTKGGSRVS